MADPVSELDNSSYREWMEARGYPVPEGYRRGEEKLRPLKDYTVRCRDCPQPIMVHHTRCARCVTRRLNWIGKPFLRELIVAACSPSGIIPFAASTLYFRRAGRDGENAVVTFMRSPFDVRDRGKSPGRDGLGRAGSGPARAPRAGPPRRDDPRGRDARTLPPGHPRPRRAEQPAVPLRGHDALLRRGAVELRGAAGEPPGARPDVPDGGGHGGRRGGARYVGAGGAPGHGRAVRARVDGPGRGHVGRAGPDGGGPALRAPARRAPSSRVRGSSGRASGRRGTGRRRRRPLRSRRAPSGISRGPRFYYRLPEKFTRTDADRGRS
jgi:hypothetical protein